MKQHRILNQKPLLDQNGSLMEIGYATELLPQYQRDAIKANSMRIKEWDYYLIYNNDYAVCLTIDDNSYMGLDSISFIDFKKPFEKTVSAIKPFTFGKIKLPESSLVGDVSVNSKNYHLSFTHKEGGIRHLEASYKNFLDGKDIRIDFDLFDTPRESMVITLPFDDKPKAFYYNQKIIGFKAKGEVLLGDEKIAFSEHDTTALLDWGRGVWTYANTWYWGAACQRINDKMIGFNIGYGFGNNSNATENAIFVDGVMHKLDQVVFNIPTKDGKDDFMSEWTFTSNDGRFEMKFKPIINRSAHTKAVVIQSLQDQIFGLFTGKLTLDDKTVINVNNMLGFAEKVSNKW